MTTKRQQQRHINDNDHDDDDDDELRQKALHPSLRSLESSKPSSISSHGSSGWKELDFTTFSSTGSRRSTKARLKNSTGSGAGGHDSGRSLGGSDRSGRRTASILQRRREEAMSHNQKPAAATPTETETETPTARKGRKKKKQTTPPKEHQKPSFDNLFDRAGLGSDSEDDSHSNSGSSSDAGAGAVSTDVSSSSSEEEKSKPKGQQHHNNPPKSPPSSAFKKLQNPPIARESNNKDDNRSSSSDRSSSTGSDDRSSDDNSLTESEKMRRILYGDSPAIEGDDDDDGDRNENMSYSSGHSSSSSANDDENAADRSNSSRSSSQSSSSTGNSSGGSKSNSYEPHGSQSGSSSSSGSGSRGSRNGSDSRQSGSKYSNSGKSSSSEEEEEESQSSKSSGSDKSNSYRPGYKSEDNSESFGSDESNSQPEGDDNAHPSHQSRDNNNQQSSDGSKSSSSSSSKQEENRTPSKPVHGSTNVDNSRLKNPPSEKKTTNMDGDAGVILGQDGSHEPPTLSAAMSPSSKHSDSKSKSVSEERGGAMASPVKSSIHSPSSRSSAYVQRTTADQTLPALSNSSRSESVKSSQVVSSPRPGRNVTSPNQSSPRRSPQRKPHPSSVVGRSPRSSSRVMTSPVFQSPGLTVLRQLEEKRKARIAEGESQRSLPVDLVSNSKKTEDQTTKPDELVTVHPPPFAEEETEVTTDKKKASYEKESSHSKKSRATSTNDPDRSTDESQEGKRNDSSAEQKNLSKSKDDTKHGPTPVPVTSYKETTIWPDGDDVIKSESRIYSSEEIGWKPPKDLALANYGESRYAKSLAAEKKQDPDPGVVEEIEKTLKPIALQSPDRLVETVQNTSPNRKKKKVVDPNAPPPLPEVAVVPPPDDESTLGTEGVYLERFPPKKKKKQEAARGERSEGIYTDTNWAMPPTPSGDYVNRQDPPGESKLFPFNPQRQVVTPVQSKLDQVDGHKPPSDDMISRSLKSKSTYPIPEKKAPSDVSSSWIPSDDQKQTKSQDRGPVRIYYKNLQSDDSDSPWVPPGVPQSRPTDDMEIESRRVYVNAIMARKRNTAQYNSRNVKVESRHRMPIARVDYTGAISTSSSSRSKATPSIHSNSERSEPSESHDSQNESFVMIDYSESSRRSNDSDFRPGDNQGAVNDGAQDDSFVEIEYSESSRRNDDVGVPTNTNRNTPVVDDESFVEIDHSESSRTSNNSAFDVAPSGSDLFQQRYQGGTSFLPPIPEQQVPVTSNNQYMRSTSVQQSQPYMASGIPQPPPYNNDINRSGFHGNGGPAAYNAPSKVRESLQVNNNNDGRRRMLIVVIVVIIFLVLAGGAVAATLLLINRNDDSGGGPTQSPVSSPSMSPQALRSLVLSASPETEDELRNPNSPQSLALDWLERDAFLGSYSDERTLQRYALATVYYSTEGDDWTRNPRWLGTSNECDWYSSVSEGDICTSSSVLEQLDIRQNNLAGTIPWEELNNILGSQLVRLTFPENNIRGSLSTSIGKLTSLFALNLENNGLSGSLPTQVGLMTSARNIFLSDNSLTGSLPSQISRLTELRNLRLTRNSFRGSIPSELGRLTNLRNLYLDENNFFGLFPQQICDLNLDNIVVDCQTVLCDCCSCSGEPNPDFPTSPPVNPPSPGTPTMNPTLPPFGTPTNGENLQSLVIEAYPPGQVALEDPVSPQSQALRWLESSANSAVTTEESYLQRYALATLYFATDGSQWVDSTSWLTNTNECSWKSTKMSSIGICDPVGRYLELHLDANNLRGELPPELAILSTSLRVLTVKGNQLSGPVPLFIADMNLDNFDISSNELSGRIPTALGTVTSLKQLSLFDNKLFGTIPTTIASLSRLEVLDLGSNQFSGTIPSEIGQLSRLAGLSVFGNFLSGTLPVQLGNLGGLELLYVDSNDLRAPVSNGICDLNLVEFWSDCEEIQCLCCTTCCSDAFGCVET